MDIRTTLNEVKNLLKEEITADERETVIDLIDKVVFELYEPIDDDVTTSTKDYKSYSYHLENGQTLFVDLFFIDNEDAGKFVRVLLAMGRLTNAREPDDDDAIIYKEAEKAFLFNEELERELYSFIQTF